MKIIKAVFLLSVLSFFISFPLTVEARDCSNPKGFHEKMMCKVSGSDSVEEVKVKKDKKKKKKERKEKLDAKYDSLVDILKELKKKKN